jgi:hypothetical protein
MSDTYSRARVTQGFKELLQELRELDNPDETAKRIRANTAAREAAIERVRQEYRAYGIKPPSELALSMTARKELGIGIVWVHEDQQENAA